MSASPPVPSRARSRPLLPLVAGLLGFALFAFVTVGVQRGLFVTWDATCRDALHAHAVGSPETTAVFAGVTALAAERSLWAEVLALLVVLAAAQRWRWCGVCVLAFSSKWIVSALKVLIDRPRPVFPDPIVTETSRSYPSGHAAGAMVVFGLYAYFLAKKWPKLRLAIVVLAGWLIFAVGFSRIYLGAHWLSDVLGGFAFGLGWLLLCIAAGEAMEK